MPAAAAGLPAGTPVTTRAIDAVLSNRNPAHAAEPAIVAGTVDVPAAVVVVVVSDVPDATEVLDAAPGVDDDGVTPPVVAGAVPALGAGEEFEPDGAVEVVVSMLAPGTVVEGTPKT